MNSLAVVLPNYNHGHIIGRAIEAIITQSRPPDQLIIVDDGSTDNSVHEIESCIRNVPCAHFAKLSRNTKSWGALDRAMALMSSEYAYFAAADDYVLPGFFEKAMQLAETNPSAGLLYGSSNTLYPDGSIVETEAWAGIHESGYHSPQQLLDNFYLKNPLQVPGGSGTIYRYQALQEMGGFRPELGHRCDSFVNLAISLKFGMCILQEPVSVWSKSPGSLSQNQIDSPRRALDDVGRAAWLMRSERYRGIFPPAFVSRWEESFRDHLVQWQTVGARKRMFARLDPVVCWLNERNGLARKAAILLDMGVNRFVAGRTRAFERRLRTYSPDLSCYDVKS